MLRSAASAASSPDLHGYGIGSGGSNDELARDEAASLVMQVRLRLLLRERPPGTRPRKSHEVAGMVTTSHITGFSDHPGPNLADCAPRCLGSLDDGAGRAVHGLLGQNFHSQSARAKAGLSI